MAHNQFELLKQRRFLPFFLTQALGAFNDNVFRNAMLALMVYQMGLSTEQSTLYANLAPALFILPYFLFSATAGQIAEKVEKAKLIRITTATIINTVNTVNTANPTSSLLNCDEIPSLTNGWRLDPTDPEVGDGGWRWSLFLYSVVAILDPVLFLVYDCSYPRPASSFRRSGP